MALYVLVCVLAIHVFPEKLFERSVTEILNFFGNNFNNLSETFHGKYTSTRTLLAWATLLVDFATLALVAGHLLFDAFFTDQFTFRRLLFLHNFF